MLRTKRRVVVAGGACFFTAGLAFACSSYGQDDSSQPATPTDDGQAPTEAAAPPLPVDGASADDAGGIGDLRLAMGLYYVCAYRVKGKVKCWGDNSGGQLGIGDVNDRGDNANEMGTNLRAVELPKPVLEVAAARSHTCALLVDGSVYCWGVNLFGQLGLGDKMDRLKPASEPVPLGGPARAIRARGDFTCVLMDDAAKGGFLAKCFGQNAYGMLGYEDNALRGDDAGEIAALSAIKLPGKPPADLQVGNFHTCALLTDKAMKCWGYNTSGQLGYGTTETIGDNLGEITKLDSVTLGGVIPSVLVVGGSHTCLTTQFSTAQCFGNNSYGQLGRGSLGNFRDDGGATALATVPLGNGRLVKSLTAGWEHNCAILENDSVKCWGLNTTGQLGLGELKQTRGLDQADLGDGLPIVPLGPRKPKAIYAGGYFTCVVFEDNEGVRCWGDNTHGELGVGDNTPRGRDVNTTPDKLNDLDLDLPR